MRNAILALCLFLISMPALAKTSKPWFFAVLSDPQMGMFAHDRNSIQETANFKFVIESLNRLHPKFVVVCGDLVNRAGDAQEIAIYKRILGGLDRSIPVYNVAGNHDVGNVPTPATLRQYRSQFGPDYYTFRQKDIFGIVLDSNLIRSPEKAPKAAKLQEEWLQKTLSRAKHDPGAQIVVFQHIPYFDKSPNEAENYFNIPPVARHQYLGILKDAGVKLVFAGHLHKPETATDGSLTEIIAGAVGKPLGGSVSGFRIAVVSGKSVKSTWLCLGGIPNLVDPSRPIQTPCSQ